MVATVLDCVGSFVDVVMEHRMDLEVKSHAAAEPAHRAVERALGLIAPETLAGLRQRRNGPGLRRLAVHLGLLAASGAVILAATHWTVWLVASLVYGIALVFLFTLEHETIHHSAFASDRLNRLAATLAGIVVVTPARWFRYFHFAHHRHTQDAARDPELSIPKPTGWPTYLAYLTAVPYWIATLRTLAHMALGRIDGDYVPPARRADVVREARLHVGLYVAVAAISLACGNLLAVKLWVVPLLIGQPFLRAYLLAEHGACPLVADMLENSRTTFASRLVNFIAWNMPHHTAHHAFPTVPFHRLPDVTAIIKARIAITADGYPEAHRQIRDGWQA
jgi:fatty acid desaturase